MKRKTFVIKSKANGWVHWLNEWMNEWINEWMNKGQNQKRYKKVDRIYKNCEIFRD